MTVAAQGEKGRAARSAPLPISTDLPIWYRALAMLLCIVIGVCPVVTAWCWVTVMDISYIASVLVYGIGIAVGLPMGLTLYSMAMEGDD